MKIVLVQPKSCFNSEGHLWEPVGFGYIISYAKKFYPDYEFKVMSSRFKTDDEILKECEDADLVGFTVTSPQIYHAQQLSKKIKAPIIYGGAHPSIDPDNSLARGADIVVKGEGEIAFKKILDNLDFALKKKIFQEPFIKDLDALPFPDRKEINQEKYLEITKQNDNMKIASIYSSRGCPFSCTFCASKQLWGQNTRFRSANNVIEELKHLINEWGIDFLKFSDDTFTVNKKRVYEFCDIKRKNKIDIPFGCNARVDTVDYDLMKTMKEAGCEQLWFGVESGSQKILDILKKGIKKEQVITAFKNAKKLDIFTRAYFMIGNEGETEENIKETIKFIELINPDIVGVTINTPYPGSKGWTPKFRDVNWRNVDFFESKENVWGNEYLDSKQLKHWQNLILDKFKHKLAPILQKETDFTAK